MTRGNRPMLDASEYSDRFRHVKGGKVRIPDISMKDLFGRLGFDWNKGTWSKEAWENGWLHERDVLSEEELKLVYPEE